MELKLQSKSITNKIVKEKLSEILSENIDVLNYAIETGYPGAVLFNYELGGFDIDGVHASNQEITIRLNLKINPNGEKTKNWRSSERDCK